MSLAKHKHPSMLDDDNNYEYEYFTSVGDFNPTTNDFDEVYIWIARRNHGAHRAKLTHAQEIMVSAYSAHDHE